MLLRAFYGTNAVYWHLKIQEWNLARIHLNVVYCNSVMIMNGTEEQMKYVIYQSQQLMQNKPEIFRNMRSA